MAQYEGIEGYKREQNVAILYQGRFGEHRIYRGHHIGGHRDIVNQPEQQSDKKLSIQLSG